MYYLAKKEKKQNMDNVRSVISRDIIQRMHLCKYTVLFWTDRHGSVHHGCHEEWRKGQEKKDNFCQMQAQY